MTVEQLIDALLASGAAKHEEVRASMDGGANNTCSIGEVVAGCDGVLLVLNVDEIG